jgi:hypothetical protein
MDQIKQLWLGSLSSLALSMLYNHVGKESKMQMGELMCAAMDHPFFSPLFVFIFSLNTEYTRGSSKCSYVQDQNFTSLFLKK